jgi:hypothetical protein
MDALTRLANFYFDPSAYTVSNLDYPCDKCKKEEAVYFFKIWGWCRECAKEIEGFSDKELDEEIKAKLDIIQKTKTDCVHDVKFVT